MTPVEKPSGDPDERLGEAIASYLNAAERGEPVDRTSFLARHPEFGAELEVFFGNHDDLETLSRPLRESNDDSDVPWTGQCFGDYEILGEIARGGMGVVYRARQAGLNRTVALKMIRAGRLATEEDLERFRVEAKAAASLSHPNIVPIYDFSEHEKQQYFTMELIEGHTLDQHDCDFSSDHQEAARLLALVARAVHHAHQRRIIHRDLKPGNILIDRAGQPHVTDFGLAMEVEGRERLTESNILLGTLPYMAPEQLSDKVQSLTTSVDLWSLGVILYELLTGKFPFHGKTQVDTLDRIRKQEPVPLRVLNPRIPRDLEAICLKCLEKEPERRYGSALGIARDLERWGKGEPIEARPVHKVVRLWSWCRRNPAIAGLVLAATVLFVAITMTVLLRTAENRARREEILESNVFTARFASSVILNRMQEWGARVDGYARSPELIALLSAWNKSCEEHPSDDPEELQRRPERKRLQEFLDELPKEPMVVTWLILDARGIMTARRPLALIGESFKGRDYFRGPLQHVGRAWPDSVHVSSVHHSLADGLDKVAIGVPVLEGGVGIGVLSVSVTTDPTLGMPKSGLREVVLIAPFETNRRPTDVVPPGGVPDYVVLIHPAYAPRQTAVPFDKAMFPAPFLRSCDRELSAAEHRPHSTLEKRDYVDPLGARDHSGTWLAGFAPVGNTGFVVIVQQRGD